MLKSVLLLCSAILSYYCHWTLNLVSQNFSIALLLAVTKIATQYDKIRNSAGDEGLLTFYSDSWANFLPKWFYKTIYALIFLKIPDQMHHLTHAELVWLFRAGTFLPHSSHLYLGSSEIWTRFMNNQTYDTKKESTLSIATFHDSGNY